MHGSALYHPGTWSSAGRQTAAAGDITNNTTTMACLALIMVMLAFAFVSSGEADAEPDYITVSGETYLSIDDADVRTYTDRDLEAFAEYGGRLHITSETIKEGAFRNCTSIERVELTNGVRVIGDRAFQGCTNLNYIRAHGVESIGDYAFDDSGIENIGLRDALASIGDYAFRDTPSLRYMPLWETNVSEIGRGTFDGSGLRMVDLRGITRLDGTAFTDSNLELQVVRTGQDIIVDGVPKLFYDDDYSDRFIGYWKEDGTVTMEHDGYQYYTLVEAIDGTEMSISYRADAIKMYADFAVEPGKDYILGNRPATVDFPDGLGVSDLKLETSSKSSHDLPVAKAGDLEFFGWDIEGIGQNLTSVTGKELLSVGGKANATPVFSTAVLTMDHSGLTGVADASALPSSTEFTYGDRYPRLTDTDGYRHVGWSVDGTTFGPNDTITVYSDHRAISIWEPTARFSLSYTDLDGSVISSSEHDINVTVTIDGGIVPDEDDGERFVGWSVDGKTVLDSVRMTSDITLIPVYKDRPLRTITFHDGKNEIVRTAYEGRTFVIDVPDPVSETHVFLSWESPTGDGLHLGDSIDVDVDITLTAQWRERQSYDITFMDGDITIHKDVATEGIPFTIRVEDPVSEDGEFLNWNAPDGSDIVRGDSIVLDGDAVFTAEWRDLDVYVVTFCDSDGVWKKVQVTEGDSMVIGPEAPTCNGRVFLHWADTEGNEYSAGDSIEPASDIILTAQWRDLLTFTVTFDDGHGSKHPVEVLEGESIVIDIDEPTSDGEVFLGWTDREGTIFRNGDTLTPTSDITLVAQWRDLVVHTVTFFDGRANHAVEKVTEGGDLTIDVGVPIQDGKVFLHWTDSEGNEYVDGNVLTPGADMVLTAQWRDLFEYTVVFDDGHGTKVEKTVTEGGSMVIDIDEPASDGKVFLGWTDEDGVGYGSGDVIAPTSDMVLTAQWRDLMTFVVTFDDGLGGVSDFLVTEGGSLTVNIEDPSSKDGIFLHWTDSEGNEYVRGDEVVPAEDMILTAQWRERATITVEYVSEGVTLLRDSTVEGLPYTIGTDVAPPEGKELAGWDDGTDVHRDGDEIEPVTDIVLTAVWSDREVVTVTFVDGDTVVQTFSGYKGDRFTASVEDPVRDGMVFLCWRMADGSVFTAEGFVLADDVTISAEWREPGTFTVTFTDGEDVLDVRGVTEGGSLILDAEDPSDDGRFFTHWIDGNGNRYVRGDSITPVGDMVLTAQWRDPYVYSIAFVSWNHTETVEVTEGTGLTISVVAVTQDGKAFVCWKDTDGKEYRHGDTLEPASDMTLTAQWRDLERYTVTYMSGEDRVGETAFTEGDEVTVDCEPQRSGYSLVGWSTTGDGVATVHNGDTLEPDGSIVLHAVWKRIVHIPDRPDDPVDEPDVPGGPDGPDGGQDDEPVKDPDIDIPEDPDAGVTEPPKDDDTSDDGPATPTDDGTDGGPEGGLGRSAILAAAAVAAMVVALLAMVLRRS